MNKLARLTAAFAMLAQPALAEDQPPTPAPIPDTIASNIIWELTPKAAGICFDELASVQPPGKDGKDQFDGVTSKPGVCVYHPAEEQKDANTPKDVGHCQYFDKSTVMNDGKGGFMPRDGASMVEVSENGDLVVALARAGLTMDGKIILPSQMLFVEYDAKDKDVDVTVPYLDAGKKWQIAKFESFEAAKKGNENGAGALTADEARFIEGWLTAAKTNLMPACAAPAGRLDL